MHRLGEMQPIAGVGDSIYPIRSFHGKKAGVTGGKMPPERRLKSRISTAGLQHVNHHKRR